MASALLQQVQYLQENGFSEQQANAITVLHKSQTDTYSATKKDIVLLQKDIENLRSETKKDIENLRSETKINIDSLKKDIENLRSETKINIENLRSETKKDIENLRSETKINIDSLKKDIENLRAELKKDMEILKHTLTIRLGGMIFAGFLLLAGYINYLSRNTVQPSHLESMKNQIIFALEKNQTAKSTPVEQIKDHETK